MPRPATASTDTPNQPLASVSPRTPPSEWPSTTSRSSLRTTSDRLAARTPNEYAWRGPERPCPGRSGASQRPGHRSASSGHQPFQTSPVAPRPCTNRSVGRPVPPLRIHMSAAMPGSFPRVRSGSRVPEDLRACPIGALQEVADGRDPRPDGALAEVTEAEDELCRCGHLGETLAAHAVEADGAGPGCRDDRLLLGGLRQMGHRVEPGGESGQLDVGRMLG